MRAVHLCLALSASAPLVAVAFLPAPKVNSVSAGRSLPLAMSTTLPGSSHQTSSSFEVHKSTAASKPASAPVSSSRSVRLNKPLGLVLEEIDAGRPGARVKELKPGSNAAGRGINAGDVLVSINGEDCTAKSFTEVGTISTAITS